MKNKLNLILALLFFLIVFSTAGQHKGRHYPKLEITAIEDNYFGKVVIDKYRKLESLKDQEIEDWFKEQSKFYDSVVNKIPNRSTLKEELKDYVYSSNVKAMMPRSSNKRVFYNRYYLDQDYVYKVFYFDSVSKKEIELFTTKEFNEKTKDINHIDFIEPSFDGNYVAVGIYSGGGEKISTYIFDVEKKTFLNEIIERTDMAYVNWHPNNKGFFYNQLKEINNENDKSTPYENSKVKLHWIGDDPKQDKMIIGENLNEIIELKNIDIPLIWTNPLSEKIYLEIYTGSSDSPTGKYVTDLREISSKPSNSIKWKPIAKGKAIKYGCLTDSELYYINYSNNSNGTVEKINSTDTTKHEILIEKEDVVFKELFSNKNSVFVKYLKDGVAGLYRIDKKNNKVLNVALPTIGSLKFSQNGRNYDNSNNLFIGLEGWIEEFVIYIYNNKEFKPTSIRPQGKYSNTDFLVVKHIEIPSHDGAMVPISIVYSKDIKLDGSNPTILYAYGSFGITITPFFDAEKLAWFKRGGIFAVAHVRGGGEKGNKWHKGGFKQTKSNSWKDFIACSNYLIKNGYTSPNKLAAMGESAGAITVGRAITQTPDLYKAAIIPVGLLNAIRFENSINTINTNEFGTAKDSLEFQYLYDMDVLHSIKDNVKYPSILFTAGFQDSRVEPWQPAKAVARFQEASKNDDNIILFRVTDAGHFGDEKIENALTDNYSFLFWQLGVKSFQINENN